MLKNKFHLSWFVTQKIYSHKKFAIFRMNVFYGNRLATRKKSLGHFVDNFIICNLV